MEVVLVFANIAKVVSSSFVEVSVVHSCNHKSIYAVPVCAVFPLPQYAVDWIHHSHD